MGFRNPITSAVDQVARDLANQALTEPLDADRIESGALVGIPLQTSAIGNRVRIYELAGRLPDGTPANIGVVAFNDGHNPESTLAVAAEALTQPDGSQLWANEIVLQLQQSNLTAQPYLRLAASQDATTGAWSGTATIDNISTFEIDAPDGAILNGYAVSSGAQVWTYVENNSSYTVSIGTSWADLSGHNFTITPPAGKLDVEWRAPKVAVSSGGEVQLRLLMSGVVFDAADLFASGPGRLNGTVNNDGATSRTVQVQARVVSGTGSVSAAGLGPVVLRYLAH